MWSKTKIGEFLFEREGKYKPDSKELAGLKRINKIDFSGNFHIAQKLSKTNMIVICPGDLVISGINVSKGAIGIYNGNERVTATIHYSSYTFDESKIDVGYFKRFLKSAEFIRLLKDQVKGGIKTEIKPKHILPLEIDLPELKEQRKILKYFQSIETEDSELKEELTRQQTLLRKLRQQILQEAIEGKLTARWRKKHPEVEPAGELLKLIQTEKEQLIEEKIIRKQKPLQGINEEEKLFELPAGWAWCRLGELFEIVRGSSPRPKGDPRYWSKNRTPFHWITIADFTPHGHNGLLKDTKGFLTEEGSTKSRIVNKGDLLIACSGVGSVGRSIQSDIDGYIYDGLLAIRRIKCDTTRTVLKLFLKFKEAQIYSVASGANWLNINIEILSNYIFALPPIEEQKAIVAKVEKLLALCDKIEKKIRNNKNHADKLMKAVLKEAFIPERQKEKETNVISLKPTNVDFYKRTLLAAEIAYQLKNEYTLGHLKLQKLIFLCERTGNMQLPTNFLQQAAGPYDPSMARSIDKQFKQKKWFEYKKNEFPKYKPLENCGEHKTDFNKYFSNELPNIQTLIDLFRKAKSDQIEIVATLYACWEKILKKQKAFTESQLIEDFYNWSDEKEKFDKERLEKAIAWMTEKGIVPA